MNSGLSFHTLNQECLKFILVSNITEKSCTHAFLTERRLCLCFRSVLNQYACLLDLQQLAEAEGFSLPFFLTVCLQQQEWEILKQWQEEVEISVIIHSDMIYLKHFILTSLGLLIADILSRF